MVMAQLEPPSTLKDNDPETTTYNDIMRMIHIEWCFFGVFAIECLLRYLWSGYMKQARPRSLSLFVCVVVAMICHALEVWRETSGSRHF